ncbi:MAG TPA: outer membrane lipoprotein chaperone LolA [Steroidobacteraceae bacterium]|nr:outer membrane lipoprotein chaperone LolA [Steroidobacteraceae bacterium]
MNEARRAVIALLLGGLLALPCLAADTTALDSYLAGLSTWSADFTQSVVDADGKPAAGGHGRLVIVRPGRFRWESTPDGAAEGAQLLIADGRNLWFLDRDLDQATVRPLADAPPQSPAMLLAGGAELRGAFDVRADGRRDGLDWVRVTPKDPASDFREAQFGFKGKELLRLILLDKLGQRSTLRFTNVKRNAPVPADATEFVRPPGVNLIGTPVPP